MASMSFFLSIRFVCSSWLITSASSLPMFPFLRVSVDECSNLHDQLRPLDHPEGRPKGPASFGHFHLPIFHCPQPASEGTDPFHRRIKNELCQPALETDAI